MENMEDMLNMEDQSRFLYTGGEVNINLLPAFSVYLLGVAGFAVLASQLASTDLVSSRAAGPAPAQIPPDNNLPDLQQPQQRLEYYQPQQQYYQPPAAEQQQQYLQPEPRHQQYQQEYYQHQYQYGQNLQPSGVENQDFVSSQDRVDIYQKLINLQEELKKLQEAEQLLSSALSRRYTNVAL